MVRATIHLNGVTVLSIKRLEVDDVAAVISAEVKRILEGSTESIAALDDTDRIPMEIGIEEES